MNIDTPTAQCALDSTPVEKLPHSLLSLSASDFQVGSTVIYGLHGKYQIVAVETREISGQTISFYKLEIQRQTPFRSKRNEPAIWIPVHMAKEKGLRLPLDLTQSQAVYAILSTREYYFELNQSWTSLQSLFENTIRKEGVVGIAKVESYLYVLKYRQIVPLPEVLKMYELVHKQLLRELSESTGEPTHLIEDRMQKLLRQKLISDH